MRKNSENLAVSNDLGVLSLDELRRHWANAWGKVPHQRIGRSMLEKSIEYKTWETELFSLQSEQQASLNQMVAAYKRSTNYFDENRCDIKPGTQLVRNWKGERHSVTVIADGYEYKNKKYFSLSEIASQITGTRWNGWVFFGIKKNNKAGGSA